MNKVSPLKKLYTLKWLHVVLFLGMAFLLINPIGLPMTIAPYTKAMYDYINTIPAGKTVLVVPDFESAAYAESGSTMEGALKQFFGRNLKALIVGFYLDSPQMTEKVLSRIKNDPAVKNKVYGVDYAVLPMVFGGETGAASLARNIKGMFSTDVYGNPIATLPIFANLNTAADFALAITFGSEGASSYIIHQWELGYGTPVADCTGALGLTGAISNFQSRLTVGSAVGIRGAAEYELLIGKPGAALAQMDTINMAHIITVAAIIVTNIFYFSQKLGVKGGKQ